MDKLKLMIIILSLITSIFNLYGNIIRLIACYVENL